LWRRGSRHRRVRSDGGSLCRPYRLDLGRTRRNWCGLDRPGRGCGPFFPRARARRNRRRCRHRRRRGYGFGGRRRGCGPLRGHRLIHQLPNSIHHLRVETRQGIRLDVETPLLDALEQFLALQAQLFRQLMNARRQRQLLPDLTPVSQASRDRRVFSIVRVDLFCSYRGPACGRHGTLGFVRLTNGPIRMLVR
jgi:hypothetical protein